MFVGSGSNVAAARQAQATVARVADALVETELDIK